MHEKIPIKTFELPFAMQVADNPLVNGICSGLEAMKKAGAQTEFVVANMVQASAMGCAVILRAGEPPQYDKRRSPKSGLNLSKTSTQSFFKGAIPKEERFCRIDVHGIPMSHHYYDSAHLKLAPTDPDYQHTMPLDINMQDILREVGPSGTLRVLGFDRDSGLLRLEYKEEWGPPKSQFDGQFVIDLSKGIESPQFRSRDWTQPQTDPDWDVDLKIIKKPMGLSEVPADIYQDVFNKTFYVNYTEEKIVIDDRSVIKRAEVFANRPRSAVQFKSAMGEDHRYFDLIKECKSLAQVLSRLEEALPEAEAYQTIVDVYNKSGIIVAGDWDGMALGHPTSLDPKFAEVINVFAPGIPGLKNQRKLLERASEYFEQLKQVALDKRANNTPLSAFDKKIMSIRYFTDIVSDFALARAGCITAHEFLFQQVLNHAYNDEANAHYGEQYDMEALQRVMNTLLRVDPPKEQLADFVRQTIQSELQSAQSIVREPILDKFVNHLVNHFTLAKQADKISYDLPHFQHDMNVHDLYQHGFDMRNPYGCNLEGAWLLVTDASVLYGDTQEQLIDVLLTGDFLEKNRIDINHGADLSVGWDRIIERQLELGQCVPQETYEKYTSYRVLAQKDSESTALQSRASSIASGSAVSQQQKMKKQLMELKTERKHTLDAEDSAVASTAYLLGG